MIRLEWFREPLVHFLLLGAVIFIVYNWMSAGDTTKAGEIHITKGTIENLATTFARVWNRPPTPEEMDGLIQEYVHEEVCAREAIAMGLDRDDTIIRRRLRQKMEFLFQDVVAQAEPEDAELRDYLKKHAKSFRREPRFTFRHVYLNPDRHSSDLGKVSKQLLLQLQKLGASADPAAITAVTERFKKCRWAINSRRSRRRAVAEDTPG